MLTSATIIPENTLYPFMNDKNPCALARISQGHSAHPPRTAQITCPRRMLNVDVAREQHSHIVCRGQGVRGDVVAERGKHERERGEERGGAVVPAVDEPERVPEESGRHRKARCLRRSRQCL